MGDDLPVSYLVDVKDRFMSELRLKLNRYPVGAPITIRQWATCIADSAEVIRVLYGDQASAYCIELSKSILEKMKE